LRSALRAGNGDIGLARIIDRARLAERLDDAVIEQLQTEGAGPLTLEALDRQRERTRALPTPVQPVHLFDAPPPPSSAAQAEVIGKARELALRYSAGLPDFICTETVQRYLEDKKAPGSWKAHDTLEVAVALSEKGEQYKLLRVDGHPTNKKLESVGGFRSSGEFGSLLKQIFKPDSQTGFEWERWSNLRGHMVHVFAYRIDRAHSKYHLNFRSGPFARYSGNTGMRGLVYIDAAGFEALRFTYEADGIPADWPILRTPAVLDYDVADIGGEKFLVPKHVDSRVIMRNVKSRNVIEFGAYRKFSSEAVLTFEK
jgi:hypothetical protein